MVSSRRFLIRSLLLSLVFIFSLTAACGESPSSYESDCVWVDPYYRSDGACVRGHWRSTSGGDCSKVGTEYEDCN